MTKTSATLTSVNANEPLSTISAQAPSASRPETIQRMFGLIARRYDLANSVLSLGIHHLWRKSLIRASGAHRGSVVFDAATGTGDLALAFAPIVGPTGKVVGGDFAEPMLEQARLKEQGRFPWLSFQFADVMQLPFSDHSFDVVSIAFGIRNVSDPVQGLRELARVLKPGGKLMVLEFGTYRRNLWGRFFGWYSAQILPRLGGLVTGEQGAYRYLDHSSRSFPSGSEFRGLLEAASTFTSIEGRPLLGGVAYLYTATK